MRCPAVLALALAAKVASVPALTTALLPQITFPTAVCLTGVKVGAVPSATSQTTRAFVHLFGRDLSCLSSGRFAQITDGFEQPDAGTKAVRFEVRRRRRQPAAVGSAQRLCKPPQCLLGHAQYLPLLYADVVVCMAVDWSDELAGYLGVHRYTLF
jgi:hypothetical protein